MELFEREEQIHSEAEHYMELIENGGKFDSFQYYQLIKEYGNLLHQIRNFTKISDMADLDKWKLELIDNMNYDVLTGIHNKHYMEITLHRIVNWLSRSGGRLSVLMIDIDSFKEYNNKYSCSFGDECLKAAAKAFRGCLKRADDFCVRYGGDEFIAVLPNTGEEGARMMANRMLKCIRNTAVSNEADNSEVVMTVSIGAATGNVKHPQSMDNYIERAAEALSIAKREGNRYMYLDLLQG